MPSESLQFTWSGQLGRGEASGMGQGRDGATQQGPSLKQTVQATSPSRPHPDGRGTGLGQEAGEQDLRASLPPRPTRKGESTT